MEIVHLANMCMPVMDKLVYHVLQTDNITQENLPKIEVFYNSIPSNYHAIMGDQTLNEIGDIIIPKMKVFDTKDFNDESSHRNVFASENVFKSNDSVNSAKVATVTALDDIDIIHKHGIIITGKIMLQWKQCRDQLLCIAIHMMDTFFL